MKLPPKLAHENLDYTLDAAAWLDAGDLIVSATTTLLDGSVTLGPVSHTASAVSFWLSGGTKGISKVEVAFQTEDGRTFAERVSIQIL